MENAPQYTATRKVKTVGELLAVSQQAFKDSRQGSYDVHDEIEMRRLIDLHKNLASTWDAVTRSIVNGDEPLKEKLAREAREITTQHLAHYASLALDFGS